ncbi:hypothetical protein Q3G72_028432 [Acer saccharum]|nr:hypothetical protein Q3G72_028432 [Acer saccharum]
MYRLSLYYTCSTLCDMVAHVFYPSFFMVIVYFMAGLKGTVPCFFLTLFSILLIAVTGQHIPKFMQWLKYLSFMYYGFRLLLQVQYSGGGCQTPQSSPSFDMVNLSGSLQEVWVLLAMAFGYRLVLTYAYERELVNAIFDQMIPT